LREKIAIIDEETAVYTASADTVGAVDEEKYAKQLAQRAAFEAELAEMARESSDREFNDAVRLSSDKLKLAELQADNEIQNTEELERKKKELRLAALQEQLALTKQFFGELSEEEQIQLDTLAAMIEKLKIDAATPPEDGGTLASGLGIDEEGLEKAEAAFQILSDGLNAVSQIVNAQATVQLNNLDARTQAEIDAVETSTATEEVKAAKIKAIERKAATEEYEIKKKQFEGKIKKISITQANYRRSIRYCECLSIRTDCRCYCSLINRSYNGYSSSRHFKRKTTSRPKVRKGWLCVRCRNGNKRQHRCEAVNRRECK